MKLNVLVQLDSDMDSSEDTVLGAFKAVSARKTCGPDVGCGRVLKYCTKELCAIFRFIYQASVNFCKLPQIWKTATIIPVPRKIKSFFFK